MKKSKYSITFKVLMGYLLLTAFGVATVWFVYTKVVELNKPVAPEDKNQKMVLIGEAATRLYTVEGIGRNIIQNEDTEALPQFHKSIDSISTLIDSLKTLYDAKDTQNELDSIHQLLALKEQNLGELLELRRKNRSENYYDRVLKRLEEADYIFESDNYREQVKDLKPYQQKVIIDYLEYAKKDNADRLTNRTADSLIKTMKKVLLSLEMKEHRYQQNLAKKEDKLLANDLKISGQLRKIRARIEQEEIQKSLARVKSTRETLNQTSKIMTIFGISCVVTILIFVILIVRDTNRSQRYRKALEEAKTYAEGLLKSREQIMAAVTHDLRSPLNSILGYSDLMDKTDLTPKQKAYLRQLKKSSDYTMRLVNDLLDFSRLEAGKIRVEKLPFVPKDVVEDSVNVSIPSPDPKDLKVEISLSDNFGETFVSDPFRLRQILVNLIGNAYKFTENGSLRISGEILKKKKEQFLEICISDSGIGISKKQQELIFQEFSQAEAFTEKRYGGSGLGLAISKKMATLLKGSISVKSKKGQGSTFTLKVPVGRPKEPAFKRKVQNIKLKTADNYRVLIADDEEAQLNLAQEVLKSQGFRISTVTNGEEALTEIKRQKPDVVLTDIQMPDLDGFGLMRQVKKGKGMRDIPVIALSGNGKIAKKTYLKKGFAAYLLKPYEANALLKLLAEVLDLDIETTTAAPDTEEPKNTLYDLTDLKVFAGDDKDSLRQILKSFMENTSENLKVLNAEKHQGFWEKIAFTAHKMLPMLHQIKAQNAIAPLEKLERYKSEKLSPKEAESLIDKATTHVRELLEALEREVIED